jgi:hypothetical protein
VATGVSTIAAATTSSPPSVDLLVADAGPLKPSPLRDSPVDVCTGVTPCHESGKWHWQPMPPSVTDTKLCMPAALLKAVQAPEAMR